LNLESYPLAFPREVALGQLIVKLVRWSSSVSDARVKTLLCGVVAALLLSAGMSEAVTFYYPKQDAALFTMDVPDTWKPEVLDDGSLEANSPDEKGYMCAWILKSNADYEKLESDLSDLLEPYLKDIKVGEEGEAVKGENVEFQVFSGTGKDKEDGSAENFEVFLFKIAEGQVGVFFVQYAADAPADTTGALVAIAKSIKLSE
jgi:hypothetical protein